MNDTLEALRKAFRAARIHAVLVEDVLPEESRAPLRERVRAGLVPYWRPERGHYQVNESLEEPEVAAVLAEVASSIVERTLAPAAGARWQRLVHRDFALYRDDYLRWRGREGFELTVDLSAAASQDGQIVYRDAEAGFVVPQTPGQMSLIERSSGLRRYERYLTHRVGQAEVFRLSLPLRVA